MLLDGVMLLWFLQVAIAVVFVAVDIRGTPEATVMKWGFVVVTAFSSLFGALLYVLSCREPLPGTHEQYVAAKWRQVVGSTMHCVAGDGIGILVAAVAVHGAGLPQWGELLCEYGLGFLFGWTVFQALFMKSMFGGYRKSLTRTFVPELLSMNAVMGGMTAVMVPWMTGTVPRPSPSGPTFWFIMSISLCAGFLVALPMNAWLVDRGLKHGMMTVRRGEPVPLAAGMALAGASLTHQGHGSYEGHGPHEALDWSEGHDAYEGDDAHERHDMPAGVGRRQLIGMTAVSFLVFAAGVGVAAAFGDLSM